MFTLFNEHYAYLEEMRKLDFDFVLVDGMPAMALFARALDVPFMMQASYMPDPYFSVILNIPS